MDGNFQELVARLGPQMLSMFLGLIVGTGATGLLLACAVHYRRRDSREFRMIATWLGLNVIFAVLGAGLLLGFEARSGHTTVLSEIPEFLREIANSHKVVGISLVTGVMAAALTAYAGYLSSERHQHRPHVSSDK